MKMFFLVMSMGAALCVSAQEDAWVYFADKPGADTYLANPLTMLSQRALDRRTAQGIALDTKDVPLSQDYVDLVESAAGIEVMSQSKWFNCVHVRGSEPDVSALTGLPFVDHIEFADASLNAPAPRMAAQHRQQAVNKQYDVMADFPYGTSQNQVQMLNGHMLHQVNYTGTGKVIAVLDAGYPGVNTIAPFNRLRDADGILGGYDFVHDSDSFYNGGNHGTLVLSTMAGYVENELVGTAPDAKYYLFITEDVSSENPVEESYWVEAAEKADSLGVDVINTSLGYFGYDDPDYSHTYPDMDGVTNFISKGADIAFSRGMIVVASAGNTGASAEPHIGAPADALNVLTIGAVNSTSQYAPFSSIGTSFDGRVKPDVAAQGAGVYVAQPTGAITTANGTSFSSPITAGLVACLWQALPTKTNSEIVQLVKQSASQFNTPNTQLGYGIPDFNLALTMSAGGFTPGEFGAFPNPVKDVFHITLPKMVAGSELSVYDATGKLIRLMALDGLENSVDLSALASGLYIYKVTSGKINRSGKLLKQ